MFHFCICEFQEYWTFKNTEFSKILNAGKQETRYFFGSSKKKSVKKLNYHFLVLFIFQTRVIQKTPDLFFCGHKRKRNILDTKRNSKRGHLLVSNTITKTEMVSEKYLTPTVLVIHNTVKMLLSGAFWEFVLTYDISNQTLWEKKPALFWKQLNASRSMREEWENKWKKKTESQHVIKRIYSPVSCSIYLNNFLLYQPQIDSPLQAI